MWFLLWATWKLLWFRCSKPGAQISPAISTSADHAGQPVCTSGDWGKSWRPREMFSSLLYRNPFVSSTATTNCTYPKIRYSQLEKACSGSWSVASQEERNWQHCAFTCWNYTVCPWPKAQGLALVWQMLSTSTSRQLIQVPKQGFRSLMLDISPKLQPKVLSSVFHWLCSHCVFQVAAPLCLPCLLPSE